jgi:uncharacterized membrane protein SpoIIM required for sporulation
VDIDWYIARNQSSWERLNGLTIRARRRVDELQPSELDELLQLYQRTSAQLSYARTYFHDPGLTARLTHLVANASGVIYGKRARTPRTLRTFFAVTYPAAVWDSRRFVMIGAAFMFVPALLIGAWLIHDPRALDASGSRTERQHYVRDQFEQYYSDQPHALFFTKVTVNNILVAFEAFGGGAAFMLFGILALVANGVNLGVVGAWMITAGSGERFFGLIAPHGLLELSAICIAAGAGLRLGWVLIAPGDRTRGAAAAEQGRRSIAIAMGIPTMFICAGTIEGFVTGSNLAPGLRILIGVVAWVAYVTYLVVFGRRAAAQGYTGELGEVRRATDRLAAREADLASV